MNRIMKFKGKRKDNEEWTYGNLIIDENKYYICLGINEHIKRDDYAIYMVEVVAGTIGQFTGLYDKNGKEIYEDDIVYVISEDENAFILWLNENAKFILEFDDWFSDFDCYYGKDLEVIGNIYDNKNLLEKGG